MTLSYDMLIPLAVFVAITLGTWAALGIISGRPQRAEDRLQRLLEGTAGRDVAEAGVARRQEAFQAKVTAAARKLGQSLRPSDEAQVGKVRLKLLNAGYRQENAVTVFFGLKALTAEGRLSGIVLLAMPPALLAFLATVNYSYVSVLFTTPVGVKLLTVTAVLQVVGAWAIKQIVAIKV